MVQGVPKSIRLRCNRENKVNMGRRKKVKNVLSQQEPEVKMSDTQVLEEVKNEVAIKPGDELENLEAEVDRVRKELEETKTQLLEKKQELKTMNVREVTEDEMVIVKKDVRVSQKNSALTVKIQKQKEYDNVMVTGRFMNRRCPGKTEKLTYGKYDTDIPKWWTFVDGQTYTIPRGFADQINEHYYTPKFVKNENVILDPSNPESGIHSVDTSNKKYAFVPIGF